MTMMSVKIAMKNMVMMVERLGLIVEVDNFYSYLFVLGLQSNIIGWIVMENYMPVFTSFRQSNCGALSGLEYLNRKKVRLSEQSDHRRFASQLNPNMNITDAICRQKYLADDAFSKKKQLRRQSLSKVASGLRIRSISTFGTIPHTASQLHETDTNRVKNRYANQQYTGVYETSAEQKFKLSSVKLQKSQGISQNQTLDWSKKNRKKPRKLTDQIEQQKVSNQQSTVDMAREDNWQRSEKKRISFKRSLSKESNLTRQFKAFKEGKLMVPDEDRGNTFRLHKKNDFQIGKKLGAGNFSTAYLARHKKTGFICAMKIMSKQKIKQQQYQHQIAREITIQSYLKHQNIVELYGVFEDFQNVYLLMEFCTDGHLFSQIRKNSRLDEKVTTGIVKGISQGIQYMQRQAIIHRDLKPENIFMCFGIPKVGDFGWAVYQGKDGLMRKTISGSPLYYSPEIVQKEDYDEKVDIWGIGTITFQCLIGMAPFKVYSVMNLNRIVNDSLNFPSYVQISDESVDFIQRCLKKKAEQRWSIQQLLRHEFFKLQTN